jgi:hypothetical protein
MLREFAMRRGSLRALQGVKTTRKVAIPCEMYDKQNQSQGKSPSA